MDILFLVGRILFGGYFLMMGVNHFMKAGMLRGYAQSKGVPAPAMAVAVGGVLLLAGSLSVLFGVYVIWGLWALVVFLVPVAFKMHDFWTVEDPQAKMAEMTNFLKNIALAGAVLMMMMLQLQWPYALNF